MGGLVIDIVLAFLFKSFVRAFHFVKSLRWQRSPASVLKSTVLDPFLGCPSVRVHYQVVSTENSQQGWDEVPFCFRGSARRYAQSFSRNEVVTVRVNPDNSREMYFFPDDHRARMG